MNSIFYGATDAGCCRENNEDNFLLEQNGDYILNVVADGCGGYEGGEMASYLACKCIKEHLDDIPAEALGPDTLKQAVIYANNAIVSQHSNPYLSNMCCVLTAALFDIAHAYIHMCHVGDTRLYQYIDGKLEKLSRDHSLVGKQEDSGLISEEEAMRHPSRNIITRAVGSRRLYYGTDYITSNSFPIQSDAQYMICSDGLYDMVSSSDIAEILKNNTTPQEKVESLISAANKAGGKDNITVTIVETTK